jgi:hypothetical protein
MGCGSFLGIRDAWAGASTVTADFKLRLDSFQKQRLPSKIIPQATQRGIDNGFWCLSSNLQKIKIIPKFVGGKFSAFQELRKRERFKGSSGEGRIADREAKYETESS